MRAFVYDTETTGLPLYQQPSGDVRQPHLVEVAAMVFDTETLEVFGQINTLIRPDEWTIPAESTAIHGITNKMAREHGIYEGDAVVQLIELWQLAEIRIGYSESFDARQIRIALHRYSPLHVEPWQAGVATCVGQMARQRLGAHHMPTLVDAYAALTDETLQGAHRAWPDMEATRDLYLLMHAPWRGDIASPPMVEKPTEQQPQVTEADTWHPAYPVGFQGKRRRKASVAIHG
jgi:DNA polymerase III subunit epsilon